MKHLFEQTSLGTMELKNRFWRSATWMNMADAEGHLTERLERIHLELARGEVAAIITGNAYVFEHGHNPGMMAMHEDRFIAEHQVFTRRVKAEGAGIFMQIVHGGSAVRTEAKGLTLWGPSAVEHPMSGVTPVEMTREDIRVIVESFGQAARRVKEAGYDGVQLHAAHSYLLSQFLTPYYNRRGDEYGGSINNRARIIHKVLERVREQVGPTYPVLIKMHCSDDWGELGLTEEESVIVARGLEDRGITAIEFSGGTMDDDNFPNRGPIRTKILKRDTQSYFADQTARIAKGLNVPVISVGGHRDLKVMQELLETTRIDYFALSRPLISEPGLIKRWAEGDTSPPRCISCTRCWDPNGNSCILDKPENTSP